jgi:hypothetical protein
VQNNVILLLTTPSTTVLTKHLLITFYLIIISTVFLTKHVFEHNQQQLNVIFLSLFFPNRNRKSYHNDKHTSLFTNFPNRNYNQVEYIFDYLV